MIRKNADLHPPLPEGEETGLCADGLDVCPREVVLKLKKNHKWVQVSHEGNKKFERKKFNKRRQLIKPLSFNFLCKPVLLFSHIFIRHWFSPFP